MQGSLYPDGVLVDRTALLRTEVTKAYEILRNRVMMTTRGIYSGGAVTVNGTDATKINLAQIAGFVPNGEYVETPRTSYSLTLSDYTVDTVNLICVVYTEVETGEQPHETQAVTKATKSEQSYRIRVYTQAEYDALEETDSNLDNDAKDRILVAATVTANGVGVNLTESNIITSSNFSNILSPTPIQLSVIAGVTITAVSSGTNTGDGTVEYDDTSAPTYKLRWTPNGGTAGSWVNFTEDSEKSLVDGGGTEYITVLVALSQLPTIGGTTSETVSISNIYEQVIPRFSAEDLLHRNMMGTGIATPENPHAQSVDDLTGADVSLIGEHRDVMHCNGIWRNSSSSIFAATVNAVSDPLGDTLNITSPVSSDLYYINGKKLNTINRNSITFKQSNFTSGWLGTSHLGAKFYEICVADEAVLIPHLKAEFPAVRNCSGVWIVDMSKDHPAGNFDLTIDTTGAWYSFRWDGGQQALISGSTISVDGQVVRLYSQDGKNWVEIWVNRSTSAYPDANLPSGTSVTDSINVYDSLDRDENMQVLSICYWWEGTRGTIGYEPYTPPASALRKSIDKRPWGNLCVENMSDEALKSMTYNHADEQHVSGVITYRNDGSSFIYSSLGGLDVSIAGGPYVLRGKRIEVDGTDITLADDSSTLIYLDGNGNYQTLIYSDPSTFNGDLTQAMLYVIGSSFDRNVSVQSEWNNNRQYQKDYPERGVVLYNIVTAGGSVSSYNDLARAVDQYVEPWTVAKRRNGSAQFDNLYSAFLYYSVYAFNSVSIPSIEIKVVGYNQLPNMSVTQPIGVRVSGVNDINFTVFNTNSQLVLSAYSEIYNLNINSSAVNPAIILGSITKVTDCSYSGGGGGPDYMFGGSAGLSNVVIKDNIVSTQGGMFHPDLGTSASTNINWDISGNQVEINTIPITSGAAIDIQGSSMNIRQNRITTRNGTGNYMAGIRSNYDNSNSQPGLRDSIVADNVVYIGDGDQAASEFGISVVVGETRISGNRVDRSSSATNETGVGIAVFGASNSRDIIVTENIVTNMAAGIWVSEFGTSGVLRQVKVDDNIVRNSFVKGIYLSAINDLIDVSICGNKVRDVTRSGVSPLGWLGVYGIDVDKACNNGTSDTDARTIKICDNNIYNVSHTSQAAYGIELTFLGATGSSAVDNIKLCQNSITNIVGVATGITRFIKIYFDGSSSSNVFYNISADDNDISGLSLTNTGTFKGIDIEADGTVSLNNVSTNDNNISLAVISNHLSIAGAGEGIELSSRINQINVCGNNIVSPKVGINCLSPGVVNNNTIFAFEVGIYCGDSLLVGSNEITVMTYYENSSKYGRNGSHGIVVDSGDVIISGNNISVLERTLTISGILRASTCIYDRGINGNKISNNKLSMGYSSLFPAGTETPTMLLMEPYGSGGDIYIDVNNNNFDNYLGVPNPALGNSIEIDGTNKTGGRFWCTMHSNTINGSIAGSWDTSASQPYEIYQHNVASGEVTWMSNHVNMAPGGTPKTYFDVGPTSNGANYATLVGVW